MTSTRWYEDRRLLEAAYKQFGSLSAAADELGGDKTTLSKWWRKHKLPRLPKGPPPSEHNRAALEELHKSVYGRTN